MSRHRRLHRRERRHRNKVIVMSLFGLILLLSCGYAAFQTSISLNAKGTIKELTAAKYLKTLVTDSGDGLYKDVYEDNRYIYRGTDVNNYIEFNGETWRIVSVESDNTIKIVRDKCLTDKHFDDNNSNVWAEASLNTYLNGDYYNSLQDTSDIVSHTWKVGAITKQSTTFDQTIETDLSEENSNTWEGKIGLLGVTDYPRSNTNTSLCGTINKNTYGANNFSVCKTSTWIYINDWFWFINPVKNGTNCPFYAAGDGHDTDGAISGNSPDLGSGVRPALYLSSDIKLTGKGTSEDMYKIVS